MHKILHISDLHLGKIVNNFSMLEDQQFILKQYIKTIETQAIDIVVIAGDIYDRAIAPIEAIQLFDNFLNQVSKLSKHILIINGNHDSSYRLGFASELLKQNNIQIVSDTSNLYEQVVIDDISFCLIPFKTPREIEKLVATPIKSYEHAMQHILSTYKPNTKHSVVICHSYIISASQQVIASESERPLAIGGSEFIDNNIFKQFDLVLAGHIHKHQHIKPNTFYSGSMMPFSFSEQNNKSGYYIHTIDETISSEYYHVNLLRKYRTIQGKFEDLLKMEKSDDYINAIIEDEGGIYQPAQTLRAVFANLMQLKRLEYKPLNSNFEIETEKLDILTTFDDFYQAQTEQKLDESKRKIIAKTLEEIEQEER